MDRRFKLQSTLEAIMKSCLPDILPDSKSSNAYHVFFQPDENIKLIYPAIVFELDNIDNKRANNKSYTRTKRYQVTILDRNPDSIIPDVVAQIPMCSFTSYNKANGLHHTIYSVYF